ncbi:uncharacterized protein DS421_14g459830 [Arachis hypogaea]|nr:uncharacterized protein DS421_14g459830 [Arachis hypogaea]
MGSEEEKREREKGERGRRRRRCAVGREIRESEHRVEGAEKPRRCCTMPREPLSRRVYRRPRRLLSQPLSPPRSPSPLLQLSTPSSMGEAEERDPGGREDRDLTSHRAQLPLLSPAILIKSAASEASGRDF